MECYQRAKELLRRGSLEESYKLFTEFIENRKNLEWEERDQELVDAFNSRGHIRYLWVDFDEAVQDYTEALRRDPLFAVAHYNRGQIHYRLGRFKLAERDLSRALELQPDFPDAQLNLTQVKRDLHNRHSFNVADQFREQES